MNKTDLELYFQYRCEDGLAKRGLADKEEYVQRLNYEIEVITQLDFCGYFLVVTDILSWARNNQIPCGPGRGSVGGSLIAYSLEITHLDPIKYNLVFERFLNPSRVSPPDIDMDFCELRRHEVVEYVKQKYGKDKVAHIGTYGSMKARGAIRDVTRVLGHPYPIGDKLANLILDPIEGKPQPLSVCYEKVPELNKFRKNDGSAEQEILSWADRVENRLRSFGTHAAGVVISNDPITQTIPLYPGKDGKATTQFEMYTVEELGLVKFDFLGLRALTTIDRCVNMVSEKYGIDIDPLRIPVDDENIYKQFQTGDLTGVFQMENSEGIRDLTVKIQPKCLEDLAFIIATFRPGPLSNPALEHCLQVKAGLAEPEYLIPELEPILKPTGGMLIFQEQILEICKQLAGYSMGEADLVRRSIGKKIQEAMAAEEPKFKQGMVNNGFDEKIADELWQQIQVFAAYGFVKAHACGYSYIGYQMAWLKYYYPLEFMCSCLISDSDEVDKVIGYIDYCKSKKIDILPPAINESETNFSITEDGKSIRFGLSTIKNLGEVQTQDLIEERRANGSFKDIMDFAQRVDLSKVNKRKMESLVLAGAFDDISKANRASLLRAVENIYEYKQEKKKYEAKLETYAKRINFYNQRQEEIETFKEMPKEERRGKKRPGNVKVPVEPKEPLLPFVPSIEEMSSQEKLAHEKELMGYYISGHPLDTISEQSPMTVAQMKEEGKSKQRATIIAIPSVITEITTKKKKQKMAYMTLEDKTGTIQATILPKNYESYKHLLDIRYPARYDVLIETTERDFSKITKVIIKKIRMLDSVRRFLEQNLCFTVPLSQAQQIAQMIKNRSGEDFNVDLNVKSQEGNLWKVGTFSCGGDKRSLKEEIEVLI